MLTHLFKQSLDVGELTQEWKSAFVTPIFKKGKRSDPSNYHPVSLTSIVCKPFEHILVSKIMKHLEANNIKKFKKGVGITIKSKETSGKLAIQL